MENWYVLYTKPKNEKKVSSQLESLGIKTYCPMVTEVRQWSDRKKKVLKPLITSYVFVKLREKDRNDVFQVPGVLRYLFWLGKPAIVRDSEIEALETWLQGEQMAAKVENILPGDVYKIKEGYFKGKDGVVREVSKNRLQLILVELRLKITITRRS